MLFLAVRIGDVYPAPYGLWQTAIFLKETTRISIFMWHGRRVSLYWDTAVIEAYESIRSSNAERY